MSLRAPWKLVSAWRTSSSEPTPMRNCAVVRSSVWRKVASVSRDRRSCSWSDAIVSQAVAISAIRLIRAERRASSLAKYCSCAARLRLRTRPNRSSSNCEKPTLSE